MRSIGYQTERFARIGLGINTASNFVRCSADRCAPAYEREFALTERTFDCRIYQRGAKWHWQVVNDFEHVLASGVAESNLEARNAIILQCLQHLGIHSDPIK